VKPGGLVGGERISEDSHLRELGYSSALPSPVAPQASALDGVRPLGSDPL